MIVCIDILFSLLSSYRTMNFLLPLVFLTILSSVMGQVKVGDDAFYGFSGQVMVRVEGIVSAGVRVRVLQVSRVWKNNRVRNPQDLVQKSIVLRASGDKESRELQSAYLNGLGVGQTLPMEIKKKEGKFWEILDLNTEQKSLAMFRLNAKKKALAVGGGVLSAKRRDGQPDSGSQSAGRHSGVDGTEALIQLERLKRENADLRSRLLKLESRLQWMEKQSKK